VTAFAARLASARQPGSGPATAAAVLAAALVLGTIAASADGLRLVIAAGATLVFLILAFAFPRALLLLVVVWLFALGTIRRVASLDTPPSGLDPLLVVGVLAVGMLLLLASRRGAFRERSALANAVLFLSGLIALSALNPLQGSLSAGAVGAISLLVPMAGFWIGRTLDDHSVAQLWKLLGALGVVAAAYGLAQVYRGFPSWDSFWLETDGYEALNVGTATRPFSTFASSAEHALLLAAALAICIAYASRWSRLVALAAAIALIGSALFVAGTRGAVLAAVLAVGVVTLARLRTPLVPAAVAAVGVVLLVPTLADRLEPTTYATSDAQALTAHQVEGLADPLGSDASTLRLHLELARDGLTAAVREPLGVGPGPITNAPRRLGGIGRPTELDPSNIAVALGLPGLAAYLVVIALGLSQAYRLARVRRDALALAALGVLTATLLQWFNGGLYLVALLPWLALGWIDRRGRADEVAP